MATLTQKLVADPTDVEVGGELGRSVYQPKLKPFSAPYLTIPEYLDDVLVALFGVVRIIIMIPFRIVFWPIEYMLTAKFVPPAEGHQAAVVSDVSGIAPCIEELRVRFRQGSTRSYQWRMNQLRGLRRMIVENEEELMKAYVSDLGKPKMDWFLEKSATLADLSHTTTHLHRLMQPEYRQTPLWMQPGSTKIIREPMGTVLIIGPYNYPLNLCVAPLAAALSAGCNVVLKPSEQMPAMSDFLAEYLPRYVDNDALAIVLGGIPETTALLDIKFDKILFTGSERVAKIIEKRVAGSLTPLCLELGGKAPVLIDSSANLRVAARRIVQTKFVNCGATCIAPDYILCEEKVHDKLVAELVSQVEKFYGPDASVSPDYAKVLNSAHMDRLSGYLDDALAKGAVNATPSVTPASDRFFPPTVLTSANMSMNVMKEEIFGPILPVISVGTIEEGLSQVLSMPAPLASYVFTERSYAKALVSTAAPSGATVVNDCAVHALSPDIPFGGRGPAGMGAYHGREGFLLFSHSKSYYDNDTLTDGLRWVRYPPWNGFKEALLGLVMGKSW